MSSELSGFDHLDRFWVEEVEDEQQVERQQPGGASTVEWQFHSEQKRAWDATERTKVIVAGRRWGKSEYVVRWLLTEAKSDDLTGAGGVSWLILPTYQMSRPLWRKFMKLDPGWVTRWVGTERAPDYVEVGTHRIEFKSGDHPERLVGEGLRRVAIDECGHVKRLVWSESVLPALLDYSAPALLTGTPKGKGWFYEQYMRGLDPEDGAVATFGGPTTQNPFIDIHEVDRLRKEMPSRLFKQEILAYFLDDEGAVFRGVRECVMSRPSTEKTVAMGVDLARKKDFTVIIGMDANRRMTFIDRFKNIPWPMQKERIISAALHPRCGGVKPKLLVDATGVGDPIVQDLQHAGLRVEGYLFTGPSKTNLVDGLIIGIEQRQVGLIDEPVLLNEMEVFQFSETTQGAIRYAAPEGLHDDCVMALAMCVRACYRTGDTGITLPPEEAEEEEKPVVFIADPSSDDHLPPGWEDPDNWV